MKAIEQVYLCDLIQDYLKDERISSLKLTNILNDLADNFAIGFSNWLMEECSDTGIAWWYHNDGNTYSSKEILEIYKKIVKTITLSKLNP